MAFQLTRRTAIIAAGAGLAFPKLALGGGLDNCAPLIAMFDGRYMEPAFAADHWPSAIARLDVQTDVARIFYGPLQDWSARTAFTLSGITTFADFLVAHGCWLEERRRVRSGEPAQFTVEQAALNLPRRQSSRPGPTLHATLYSWRLG